jgi:hypothetical protein
MAKITKSTDKSGRTVYKIAGTKKFAFTLAKAKEIAAKGSTSTKAPARRTAAARKKPSTGSAWRRVRSPEGKGYSHLRTINGVDYEVWQRIYSDGGEAIYLEVVSDRRRRILAPNGEDNGWAGVDAAKKAAVRDAKTRTVTDAKGRRAVRVKKVTAKQAVARAVPRPTSAKLMNFYRDIKEMGGEALAERGIKPATDAFALKVRAALEDAMDELEGPRRKSVAYISASGKPAIRRTTKRKTATAKPKKTTSRRKVGTRTPKIIGRAYINRYGERVGPTRILGRTVDYAMKIVRTKGRDLKATPAHRKEIVAKYRKALQKAGFLR